MAAYVYGIVDPAAKAPPGSGIAGAPLSVIAAEGAAALVSDLGAAELRMGREEVMVHADVLDRAIDRGTILPMRFGVVMDDEEIRPRLLDRHAEDLRSQLRELEGKVELHVRAVYEEESLLREIVSTDPEIARLRNAVRDRPEDATYYERIRLGELVAKAIEHQREHDADAIVGALSRAALAVDVGAAAHERVVVSAAFLVNRARVDKFDELLESIAREQAGRMRFKLTGPRAPHSFVQLSGSE